MASPSVSPWRRVISHLPPTFARIINVPTSPAFLYLMSPHPRPTCPQVPRLTSQVSPHASQCPCPSFKHSRFPSLLVLTGGDVICREMKNEKWNSNPFFNVMRIRKRKFKSVFQSYVKTKNESQICFSKWGEKWKTKTLIQLPFSKWDKSEKWISNAFLKCGENENQICFSLSRGRQKMKMEMAFCFTRLKKKMKKNEIWIPLTRAIEKRLALRYTHWFPYDRCDRWVFSDTAWDSNYSHSGWETVSCSRCFLVCF